MKIVGLSGKAGAGKDTAARALIEDGWERLSFAAAVYEFALRLDPIVSFSTGTRLSSYVRAYGWEKSKREITEVRRTLVAVGKGGREVFGENFWVDRVLPYSLIDARPDRKIVITDVRFPNEVERIWDAFGIVVRVEKPDLDTGRDESETALDAWPFDYTVVNSETVEYLHDQIRNVIKFEW